MNRTSRWALVAMSLALSVGCSKAPTPLAAPPATSADTSPAPAPDGAAPVEPPPVEPGRAYTPAGPAAPVATPAPAGPVGPVATPAPAAAGWQSGLTGIPLSLAADRQAYLALATEQGAPGEVKLTMAPGAGTAAAFRTLGLGEAPAEGPADAAVALRRLESRLDGLKPAGRYRVQAEVTRQVGDTEPVWVIATTQADGVTEQQVTARTAYVGVHCDVLVDTADGTALDARARALGQAFDGQIWPTDTRLFGQPLPVGARGDRVTLVVSPVVGDEGRDNTLGYFTARDLFAPQDAPNEPFLQHSNQGAFLYIADRVLAKGQPVEYLGTVAHEFQHLISATYKLYGPTARQESLWLNEALSMYAMGANGYGMPDGSRVITSHVAQYLASPQRYSLTRWDLNPEQSGYGVAYLFVTYLIERVGEDVLKELITSRETGVANLEARLAARGLSMQTLFRDWVAATMLDGTGAGGVHEYRTLDLRGSYAGRQLGGVVMPVVDLPNAGRVPMLPYSASYLLLRGAAGGPFTLNVAGAADQAVGAFLSPR